MNAEIQTIVALAVVALAASWLIARIFAKRKNSSCGGDCGCPTDQLKVKLKHPREI